MNKTLWCTRRTFDTTHMKPGYRHGFCWGTGNSLMGTGSCWGPKFVTPTRTPRVVVQNPCGFTLPALLPRNKGRGMASTQDRRRQRLTKLEGRGGDDHTRGYSTLYIHDQPKAMPNLKQYEQAAHEQTNKRTTGRTMSALTTTDG